MKEFCVAETTFFQNGDREDPKSKETPARIQGGGSRRAVDDMLMDQKHTGGSPSKHGNILEACLNSIVQINAHYSTRTTSRIGHPEAVKKVGRIGTANPSIYNEYLQYVPVICLRFELKLVPYVRGNFLRNHFSTLVVFPV